MFLWRIRSVAFEEPNYFLTTEGRDIYKWPLVVGLKLPLTVRWEDLMNCVSQSLRSNEERETEVLWLNKSVFILDFQEAYSDTLEQSSPEWHVMTMPLARGYDNYPLPGLITGPGLLSPDSKLQTSGDYRPGRDLIHTSSILYWAVQ